MNLNVTQTWGFVDLSSNATVVLHSDCGFRVVVKQQRFEAEYARFWNWHILCDGYKYSRSQRDSDYMDAPQPVASGADGSEGTQAQGRLGASMHWIACRVLHIAPQLQVYHSPDFTELGK